MSTTADWISDQEHDALRGAARTLSHALRLEVTRAQLESLEKAERRRLRDLCRALSTSPEEPCPSPDEAAAAEAFADDLARVPASTKRLRRQQELLAAYTHELQFLPTPAERLVFRDAPADATLDDLRGKLAKAAPEWRGSRFNWGGLADGEAGELERLVEKAIGMPDFFADRRGEARSSAVTRMLLRHAEDATARRSLLREGWVSLNPELLADVHLGKADQRERENAQDADVDRVNREIHPECERLVIEDRGRRLLPTWDPGAARGWLEASTSGNVLRVKLGERFTVDG